jgi:hypothetical protein
LNQGDVRGYNAASGTVTIREAAADTLRISFDLQMNESGEGSGTIRAKGAFKAEPNHIP